MLSDGDRRDLLDQAVSETAAHGVEVDWLASEGWSAHAKLQGTTGLVGHLLTSPEWQEARFMEPHCSTFMITDSSDRDDVRQALGRLAKAVSAYVSGSYEVEQKRGLFGTRTILLIDSADGRWRIGKRTVLPPHFAD